MYVASIECTSSAIVPVIISTSDARIIDNLARVYGKSIVDSRRVLSTLKYLRRVDDPDDDILRHGEFVLTRDTLSRGKSTCNPGTLTGTLRLSRRERRERRDTSGWCAVFLAAERYTAGYCVSPGSTEDTQEYPVASRRFCQIIAPPPVMYVWRMLARVLQGRLIVVIITPWRLFAYRDQSYDAVRHEIDYQ